MNELDVKQLRSELHLSQKALADKVGVHWRTVQNWEHGGDMSHSDYTKLCALLKGDKVSENDPNDDSPKERRRNTIPFYDDVVSVGGTNEVGVMEGVSQPTDYIDTGDWFVNATAAIRHYGESMAEYPSGCILAIREVQDKSLIVPGRDYVIETSEYRVTKQVQLLKDGCITAYSTNNDQYPDGHLIYAPFDIPIKAVKRIFAVLGYVVKKNGGTIIFNKK